MDSLIRAEKIKQLRGEIRALEKRTSETLSKSNEAFDLGGDGWHDNSAYHAVIADIDKLGVMIDQIKEEIAELQRKYGKVVIVHGTKGSRDKNWFPYLDRELSKLNFHVIRPQFPTPQGQTLSRWLKVWNKEVGQVDHGSILIGHSSAGAFLMRVLEKLKNPVRACFFVAPFVKDIGNSEFDKLNVQFYKGDYDWEKIRRRGRIFFVYASDDDPYVPLALSQEVADILKAKFILVKGAKHFNELAGFTKFPRLVKDIKNMVVSK